MTTPFDHRPDAELGEALREALTQRDEALFVRRVLAARDAMFGEVDLPWWSVLTAWARPGLVAAAGLLLAALWFGTRQAESNGGLPLADPLTAGLEQLSVPALFAGPDRPNVDLVLAVALER